jgi:hypothetical protein
MCLQTSESERGAKDKNSGYFESRVKSTEQWYYTQIENGQRKHQQPH